MPGQVVILHGWSDTSNSFGKMAEFLKQNGWEPVPLWLGDYPSMSDHVTIEDIAKRMQQVLTGPDRPPDLRDNFDMIVHSTGGLVARKWIATYYPDGAGCPVKRLIMVAPANFGSKLASTGKTLIGRIGKGWKHGGQVGKRLLDALELASDFQWDLAQEDLFAPEGARPGDAPSPYGTGKVWPFVIVGSHPYLSGFRRVVNEDGSDGTVRVPGANLNAYGGTIDLRFEQDDDRFFTPWPLRHAADQSYKADGRPRPLFPFCAVPDRDHGSITDPGKALVPTTFPPENKLDALLLEALNCRNEAGYAAIGSRWYEVSEETQRLSLLTREDLRGIFPDDYRKMKREFFHQYFQLVVRVVDDHGAPVDDYYIEFFDENRRGKEPAVVFHTEVLEDVHPAASMATRCFYIDRTDLMGNFYGMALKRRPDKNKTLYAAISAVSPGSNVRYLDKGRPRRQIRAHSLAKEGRFFRRNCTHFLKIIIPRNPEAGVFKLKAY